MLGYISERFGRSARNAWVRALTRGVSLDQATQDVFHINFAKLDADWRASLIADQSAEAPAPAAPAETVPKTETPAK
jgi:hypothetical protein